MARVRGHDDESAGRACAGPAAGQGMFIAALRRDLYRRGIVVPFDEHDLIAEITR